MSGFIKRKGTEQYRWDDPEPYATERHPQLTVGERNDQIIYGPRGEVLKRIEDRPFLGYGKRD